jgi:TonB family protein
VPLQGFQTVIVPTEIPTTIPAIDLVEHFDPKDYTGVGVEGGRADGAPVDPLTSNGVYDEDAVEERPALRSAPPAYPALLDQLGIEGHVLVVAVIDTTGRVDPGSLQILESSHPGFNEPTRRWALSARFRPGRARGQAVRVLVKLPIDYKPVKRRW